MTVNRDYLITKYTKINDLSQRLVENLEKTEDFEILLAAAKRCDFHEESVNDTIACEIMVELDFLDNEFNEIEEELMDVVQK